jgi:hypothetical protein
MRYVDGQIVLRHIHAASDRVEKSAFVVPKALYVKDRCSMRNRGTRTILAASLLAASAFAGAPHMARAAGPVLLRAHFVAGQHFVELDDSITNTKINVKFTGKNAPAPMALNQTEKDHFPIMLDVKKVYADGSALVRISFGPSTVTMDGKVQNLSMKGYYKEMHLATNFSVISSKTYGAALIPAAASGSIPNTDPTKYPAKPVTVGSTWTDKEASPPMGFLTATYTVQAIGTANGRPTITAHAVINQPAQLSESGLTFKGTISGFDDQTTYIDTSTDVVPSHGSIIFKGSVGGMLSGIKATGTFLITSTHLSTPQP